MARKSKTRSIYKKNLPTNLQRTFGGVWGGQQQAKTQGDRPVGRPRGEYKHRSPFTGQPIPATEYYKQVRDYRRIQQQRATQIANKVDTQQVQQLAKQGIPPEQAKQIVDTRQIRRVIQQPQAPQQPQNIQNLPPEIQRQIIQQQMQQRNNPYASQVPRNIPRYGRRGEFIEGDLFGRPKIKIYGDEKSFWN